MKDEKCCRYICLNFIISQNNALPTLMQSPSASAPTHMRKVCWYWDDSSDYSRIELPILIHLKSRDLSLVMSSGQNGNWPKWNQSGAKWRWGGLSLTLIPGRFKEWNSTPWNVMWGVRVWRRCISEVLWLMLKLIWACQKIHSVYMRLTTQPEFPSGYIRRAWPKNKSNLWSNFYLAEGERDIKVKKGKMK